MTTRARGLYVALSEDIREDDIEPLINAIKWLHYVSDVTIDAADPSDFVARSRIGGELRIEIFKTLDKLNL